MQFQDKDENKKREKDNDEIKKREKYFLLQAVLRFFTCGKMISIPKCCVDKCRSIKIEKSYNQAGDSKMMFTWKPSPSIWVILVKSSSSNTAILIEEEEEDKSKIMRPYRMSPETSLSNSCPIGTCFLGQAFVDDIDTEFPRTKIMIFDLIQIGQSFDATSNGQIVVGPSERYRLLREECSSYINSDSVQIQWVGDREPAESFCGLNSSSSKKQKLPHHVDCIIGLSQDHPCNITIF